MSSRSHHEHAHANPPTEPATVPLGLAAVAVVEPIRRFVHCGHENVVWRHDFTLGGHHAAHPAPDEPVAD
jgi:hypothetical protein